MSRTLLVGNSNSSWRNFLKAVPSGDDLVCLDPMDVAHGPAGSLTLVRGGHVVESRFYGSLDVHRAPHVLVGALAWLLDRTSKDVWIQLFPYRPSPVMRQTISLIAQIVCPDQILVATGTELDLDGFPVGPEVIDLEPAFPEMVQHAQRKARWLRLIEACENHVIDLRETTLEGIRLGSGRVLTRQETERMELEGLLRAEKVGSSLLVVANREPEESELSRAMDITGSHRVHYVQPNAYENLICAFSRADGQEIGLGMIRRIDWDSNSVLAVCTAVAPVPVRILRVGSLRVDPAGQEMGEIRSWQV